MTVLAASLVLTGCPSIEPPSPAPTVTSFEAAPDTITAGASAVLSWQVQNATEVVIHAVGADEHLHQGSQAAGSLTVQPGQTTIYRLTASNGQVEADAEVTVTVLAEEDEDPLEIVALQASPAALPVGGGQTTLSWEVTGAESIELTVVGGAVLQEDTEPIGSLQVALTATTTYRLTASGGGETVQEEVTVTVAPSTDDPTPVVVVFAATPGTLPYGGGDAVLGWEVIDADEVTVEAVGGAVVYVGPELTHEVQVSPTATTTYRLTAVLGLSQVDQLITVHVADPSLAIVSFVASPNTHPAGGGESTLSWVVTDADEVTVEVVDGAQVYQGPLLTHSVSVSPTLTTTYRLIAVGGTGQDTEDVLVTVEGPPPATISELSATVVPASQVQLSWTATDASGFEVYAVANDDEDDVVLLTTAAASPVTVAIPASTRQVLRVVAQGVGGDDMAQVTPANVVVVSDADYDPYDRLGYVPEPVVPGTLRQVVADAVPGAVIGFAADIDEVVLYGVDIDTPTGYPTSVDAHLFLRKDVTISGPASGVTLRGMAHPGADAGDPFTWRSRMVFVFPGQTVLLENLSITGGTFIFVGAGVRNDGDLTLRNSVVTGNRSWYNGGGIYNAAAGTLRLEDSVVSENVSAVEDDEVNFTFEIRGQSEVTVVEGGYGGGIYNDGGVVEIVDSVVNGNSVKVSGGGVYNAAGGGTITIEGSVVEANRADFSDYTTFDPGFTPFSWGGGILNDAVLVVTDTAITGNDARYNGGGLYMSAVSSSDLADVQFNQNSADFGGAIFQRYDTDPGNLQMVNVPDTGTNIARASGPFLVAIDVGGGASLGREGLFSLPAGTDLGDYGR